SGVDLVGRGHLTLRHRTGTLAGAARRQQCDQRNNGYQPSAFHGFLPPKNEGRTIAFSHQPGQFPQPNENAPAHEATGAFRQRGRRTAYSGERPLLAAMRMRRAFSLMKPPASAWS